MTLVAFSKQKENLQKNVLIINFHILIIKLDRKVIMKYHKPAVKKPFGQC